MATKTKRDLNNINKLRELGQSGNYMAFYVANQLARTDVESKTVVEMVKGIAQILIPAMFKKGGSDD